MVCYHTFKNVKITLKSMQAVGQHKIVKMTRLTLYFCSEVKEHRGMKE